MTITEKENIYISELLKKHHDIPDYKFTLEDYYHWYLRFKRFGIYKRTGQPYNSNEFDEFYQVKEKFYEGYKYIYNRLSTKKNKNEFKDDYLDQLKALKSKQSRSKYVRVLNEAIDEINDFHLQNNKDLSKTTQEDKKNSYPEIITDDVLKHPKHHPNLWNIKCYNLFQYLIDNYYSGKKRQLTNIWFYLKENNNSNFVFKATKDEYKDFIREGYGKEIKNFDKAHTKYSEKEKPSMDEHRINYEDSCLK